MTLGLLSFIYWRATNSERLSATIVGTLRLPHSRRFSLFCCCRLRLDQRGLGLPLRSGECVFHHWFAIRLLQTLLQCAHNIKSWQFFNFFEFYYLASLNLRINKVSQ